MTNVSFPLTIAEVKAMFRDNDWKSIAGTVICVLGFIVAIIFYINYSIEDTSSKNVCLLKSALWSFTVGLLAFFFVFFHRAYFLAEKEKREEKSIKDCYRNVLSWMDEFQPSLGQHYITISIANLKTVCPNTEDDIIWSVWEKLKEEGRIFWYSDDLDPFKRYVFIKK